MPLEILQKIFLFAPPVFLGGAFVFALVLFFRGRKDGEKFERNLLRILWAVLGFRVLYASAQTLTQYLVWRSDPFTRVFLEQGISESSPIAESIRFFPFFFSKMGYFLFYAYARFWLNVFIVLACVGAFWLFLRALKRWKERFFEDGEIALGALAVAIVGWPHFLVFLPVVLLSVVLVSVFKLVFRKEAYTTLGAPFLLAILLTFLFGTQILKITGLWVLRI